MHPTSGTTPVFAATPKPGALSGGPQVVWPGRVVVAVAALTEPGCCLSPRALPAEATPVALVTPMIPMATAVAPPIRATHFPCISPPFPEVRVPAQTLGQVAEHV